MASETHLSSCWLQASPRSKGVAFPLRENSTWSRNEVRTLKQKTNFLSERESKPWNMDLKTENPQTDLWKRRAVHLLKELPTSALPPMSLSPWASVIFSEPQFPYLQDWEWKYSPPRTAERVKWEKVCLSTMPNTWCLEMLWLPASSQHVPLPCFPLPHCVPVPHTGTFFPFTLSPFLPPSKLPVFHLLLPHRIFSTYKKGINKMRAKVSIKLKKITNYVTFFLQFGLFKCLLHFRCLSTPLKSQELGFADLEWLWDVEHSP